MTSQQTELEEADQGRKALVLALEHARARISEQRQQINALTKQRDDLLAIVCSCSNYYRKTEVCLAAAVSDGPPGTY